MTREHATVVHMLVDAARQSPDGEALVMGDTRLCYRDYLGSVVNLASELSGTSGGRVALLMANSPDICIAQFAVHMAGAQLVPMNPAYTRKELGVLFAQAEVCGIIYDEALEDVATSLIQEFAIPVHIQVGKQSRRLFQVTDQNPPMDIDLPSPDDPATLQFTGGTTGVPKGASISHRALMINISQREALVPTRNDKERILCVMPLFHCYAINMCLHNMVFCRGTLVLIHPYHPKTVLATMSTEGITLFGGSPTLFAGLMSHEDFNTTDFSTLDITYSGSAPLPTESLRGWEQATGSLIIEGYGQSEAGPVISFNPINGTRKQGSVGLPVPGTTIEIVDEDGAIAECGEIRVRGPQIMSHYRGKPEETSAALRDGWLYTGDIGELDEDGYLFIRGRKKEMLIVSGFNVYPNEVESALCQHPKVNEAAVVGMSDDYRGQLPIAYCVTGSEPLDADELRAFCEERLSKYKIPVVFHLLDALPKTAVGKTDKNQLIKMAESSKNT